MQDTLHINHGCNDAMMEAHNEVTMLTWISSLAIMVLCTAAFLKLFFVPAKVPSSSDTCMICGSKFEEYLVPALFLSMANTYGVIGISNYRQKKIHDMSDEMETMERVLSILPLVTSFLAVLLGLAMMGAMPTSKVVTKRGLFWVSLLSFFGLALISVVQNVHLPYSDLDLHTVVSVGGLLVLWAFYVNKTLHEKDGRKHSMIKASSVIAFVVSFGYESIFYAKCDSFEAYQNCFRDCPFSARGGTNAAINLAVLIATISWTFSENSVPSIQAPKELIAATVASFDDSASIDTIEDFQDITPAWTDTDDVKSDIESGSCDLPDQKSTTEVKYSSFDTDVIDTASSEDSAKGDSISEPMMVDEK